MDLETLERFAGEKRCFWDNMNAVQGVCDPSYWILCVFFSVRKKPLACDFSFFFFNVKHLNTIHLFSDTKTKDHPFLDYTRQVQVNGCPIEHCVTIGSVAVRQNINNRTTDVGTTSLPIWMEFERVSHILLYHVQHRTFRVQHTIQTSTNRNMKFLLYAYLYFFFNRNCVY